MGKNCKCSSDNALKDRNSLIAIGFLVNENAGGRSTSYLLDMERKKIKSKKARVFVTVW